MENECLGDREGRDDHLAEKFLKKKLLCVRQDRFLRLILK